MRWTEQEKLFVIKNANMTDMNAVDLFNKTFGKNITLYAYRKQRQRLKVRKSQGRPKKENKHAN